MNGILSEYCWTHEMGGWTCEVCWLAIRLATFAEATAMMAAYMTDWRTLLGNQADLDVYQIWNDRWNQWLDGYSLVSEVGK